MIATWYAGLPHMQNRFIETFGWVLLHSLWELAVVAAFGAVVLALLGRAGAGVRYILACGTLLLMLAFPGATFCYLLPAPSASVPVSLGVATGGAARDVPAAVAPAAAIAPAALPMAPVPLVLRLKHALEPCLPVAVDLYFLGTAMVLLRLFAGYARLRRILAGARDLQGPAAECLQRLSGRMGIRPAVRLLESAALEVPALVGALKPVILLPASALTGLSADQLSALLAHELAHIRRHDYLLNLVQSAIETLLFYHPAVWWVGSRIRQEREFCCDDAAVAATDDRLTYARALAAMESLRVPGGMAVAAGGSGGGSLLGRIERILGVQPRPGPRRFLTLSAALMLLLLGALVYMGCNRAAPAPSAAPTTGAGVSTVHDAMSGGVTAHTYDIRYLLGPATSDPKATQKAVQDLIDNIQSSVAPDSWRGGGSSGELQVSDGRLTVTQSPETLLAVDKFLAGQFATRALGVHVECRGLLVASNFLDDFRIGWDGHVALTGAPAAPPANNASIIDNWTLNLLLTATQADKRTVSVAPTQITTPNGYPVHITLKLPDSPDTPPATPTADPAAPTSISIDATPTVSADHRYIVLLLPQPAQTTTAPSRSLGEAFGSANSRIRSTPPAQPVNMISIPDGGTLLVDGGSVGARHLLILVRPNLIAGESQGTMPLFAAAGGMSTQDPKAAAGMPTQPASDQVLIKAMVVEADADAFSKAWANANPSIPDSTPITGNKVALADPAFQKIIDALVANKQAEILSRPQVLTNIGQDAVVTIGQQINYIKGFHTDPDKGPIADIDTLTTGIVLGLRPYLNEVITLDVNASITSLVKIDNAPAPHAAPGDPNIQVPVVDRRQAHSRVTIANDQSVMFLLQPPKAGKIDILFLTPHVMNAKIHAGQTQPATSPPGLP